MFTAKNDLFSETPGLLPQAVAQGQIDVTQFGHQPEEDGGVPEGAETSTDESSADTVDQEVPSHVARQDVLLFHLRDHPIRAMLNWNSYEEMMTEIAHHFSVRRLDLVEAYEVAATPPDLGQDVVPIVVHMIGDIPPTFDAQLVLADLEFHGHQVEEHFQLGPLLARHVILVPTMADRQIFLRAADVDRYCASESGRCLAYHNLIRWPDYDTAARRMAHGDYTRIALPPSESYACPTVSMVQMRQAGLSDDEIIDTLHKRDPVSGYSPSVLGEAELRELATQNLDTIDDMFSVLQTQSPNEDCRKKAVSDDFSNAGSNDPFPQGSSLCPRSHAASDDHPPKEDSTGKVQMAIEKGILHQIPWTSMQTGQYQGLHASSRAHLQPAAPAQDVAAAVSRLEPAPSDSFTDEFLQAIRAANEAAMMPQNSLSRSQICPHSQSSSKNYGSSDSTCHVRPRFHRALRQD